MQQEIFSDSLKSSVVLSGCINIFGAELRSSMSQQAPAGL